MTIFIGSDVTGQRLKDVVKTFLKENSHDVVGVTEGKELDFVDSTLAVIHGVQKNDDNPGIVVDIYDADSPIVATKVRGVTAAEVSDERSTYMTRSHNNARMITMGAEIVSDTLAKNIAREFANGHYDGGRRQVRVDTLNKMC